MVKDHSDSKRRNCSCPMGYFFWLAARVLLYAPSHRQDSTYHGLYYTSRGAQTGTKNSSMGPPWRIDPLIHHTISERSYHLAMSYNQCRIWYEKHACINYDDNFRLMFFSTSVWFRNIRNVKPSPPYWMHRSKV